MLGESREIMYPESSIVKNLELDENFRVDLNSVENLGEIVAVSGIYTDMDSVVYKYPIHSYWVTQNNELLFNSPMKYIFTNISLEYVPLVSLEYDLYELGDGLWYLPESFVMDDINFTEPFFVSSLFANDISYGTYIHPSVEVGYIVDTNEYGTYVEFDPDIIPAIDETSNVKGAVHFGKINNTYLYRFSLQDELLYKYNILETPSEDIAGTLHLDMNIGFKDVIYSELSQVACEDYNLLITLYQLSSQGNQTIGTAKVPLDKSLLGFHYYDLDINLDWFDFGTSGRLLLSETLLRGTDFDLYVTVESTISNCIVDGNLFKGIYAHELLTAGLEIDSEESDLMFNGEKTDTPYIATPQNNIILTRDGIANYVFDSSSLLYEFDFIIDSIRTDSVTLYENVHYLFDPTQKIITLIGDYRDYSGNLLADITYKAFEWNTGRISSLEPITLTFENDYLKNITKYLEFVIRYNEIPGYEMEKIDFVSGRTILSDELQISNQQFNKIQKYGVFMRELIIDITYQCNSNCLYCQWSVSNSLVDRELPIKFLKLYNCLYHQRKI